MGMTWNMEYPPDKEDRELRKRHERIAHRWLKQKPKANRCFNCNCNKIGLNESLLYRWKRFYLECDNCHWCGKSRPTIRWAISIWNKEGSKKRIKMLERIYGGKERDGKLI